MKEIGLCTFPDDDKDYCKYFEVPKDWLVDILERIDTFNERKGVNLDIFLDNYTWDETWFIYELAKCKGKIILEEEDGGNNKIENATFTSFWDGGYSITTNCKN